MLSVRCSRPASAGLNRALDDLQEPARAIEARDSSVTANSTANRDLLLPGIPMPKYRFQGSSSATTSKADAGGSAARLQRLHLPADGAGRGVAGLTHGSPRVSRTVIGGATLVARRGTPCRTDRVAY